MLFFLAATQAQAEEKEFHIYNWSNYIDKNVVVDFEARYNVKIKYHGYDSINQLRTLLEKLAYAPDAAEIEIDMVILPAFLLQGLIEQNLLAPIQKHILPNHKYVFTHLKKHLEQMTQDMGRTETYAAPYLWGTTGIAYDATALDKRARRFPRDSWELIFDPNIAAQFSDCGIVMTDRPRQIFQILKHYLGLPPYSSDREDLLAAEIALRKLRPYVEVMSGFEASNAFAFGDACIVLGQNQEILLAQQDSQALIEERRAEQGRLRKAPPRLAYKLPKQGSILWMDVMIIPIQSKKRGLGHRWIDHVLSGENGKLIATATGFATPSTRTLRLLPKKIRSSTTLYPALKNQEMIVDKELLDINKLPSSKLREQEERAWERFINLRK
jgi:putrescine transport system substrate-binding protein